MKHQPPLNDYRSRLRWCIETILRPVGIGHGKRYDIGPAERMQRGRDWYDAMEIAADSKRQDRQVADRPAPQAEPHRASPPE